MPFGCSGGIHETVKVVMVTLFTSIFLGGPGTVKIKMIKCITENYKISGLYIHIKYCSF